MRSGADYGLDIEHLIAKFRLKLKKVEKTTRPFRYDINQILYDYIVEVTNRLNGRDLLDRVPDELWMDVTLYRKQDKTTREICTDLKCEVRNKRFIKT